MYQDFPSNSERQEVCGPHLSHEKQFQSINTYAQSYAFTKCIMLVMRKKIIICFLRVQLFFIMKNLSSLDKWMVFAKFGWNWPVLEKTNFYFVNDLFAILWLSPLVIGICLSFEDTWITFTHWCFVLGLVEIGKVVLEMKIFKRYQCIIAAWFLSPLGTGFESVTLSLEQTWIPFALGRFMTSLVELAQWFYRKIRIFFHFVNTF